MIMSLKMCLILKSKLALVKKGQSLERTGDPTQKPKNADREWDLHGNINVGTTAELLENITQRN